ncbi:hypothetical protein [Achromobacter ruhlandii]|uniref:hypothetical protein n=1 Tax=Achromobacter ruhlandii TaxID=72557 RepID=UPI0015813D4F|nr:hypothetical protein [Achromobacter ruhlandii]
MHIYDLGAIPIDAASLRVTMPSYEWNPAVKEGGELIFDIPPPFSTTKRKWNGKRPENITGRRSGRLIAVGYFGRKDKGGGAENQLWVCRCSCGKYCIRRALTIKRPKDSDDCCKHCAHLKYLQRHDRFRQGMVS